MNRKYTPNLFRLVSLEDNGQKPNVNEPKNVHTPKPKDCKEKYIIWPPSSRGIGNILKAPTNNDIIILHIIRCLNTYHSCNFAPCLVSKYFFWAEKIEFKVCRYLTKKSGKSISSETQCKSEIFFQKYYFWKIFSICIDFPN